MRRKSFLCQASLIRLLLLLLIEITPVQPAPKISVPSNPFKSVTGGTTFVSEFELINRCSGKRVGMRTRGDQTKIRADVDSHRSPQALLEFSSEIMKGRGAVIKIKAKFSQKYICFSQKGKIIGRVSGGAKLCKFVENQSSHPSFQQFQSAVHPRWRLGFNKRGGRLLGYANVSSDCFDFFKIYHLQPEIIQPSDLNLQPSDLNLQPPLQG
ncbi:fibroblast growth factor 17-like [Physella acuta]|uniref:fibroblast growth factor 17-like n=1 Tax=Physella acuta TaxID=109671 RepID=UPI0027DE36E3|nr:fibroblast growth factor 17-like [Physella acuta]XP_059177263.1 fibroblast growth factor 17-like [Physella acuta]XP_059177269.1 fibroblast growth factor 17-like [Physella acuta]XP_059177277.1 fibroblast growth factor 17-like [Physella acuta]XP_059177287.1 fibroblast growth factor 17-like [Physella acuta]